MPEGRLCLASLRRKSASNQSFTRKWLCRPILLTSLLSCAVLGQESDRQTDSQVAPREVMQSFSRQFQ